MGELVQMLGESIIEARQARRRELERLHEDLEVQVRQLHVSAETGSPILWAAAWNNSMKTLIEIDKLRGEEGYSWLT